MTATTVDVSPVNTSAVGAAMNAMFAEGSVISNPPTPTHEPAPQPTPDGAAPYRFADPSQPDTLIPVHHQQQQPQMPGVQQFQPQNPGEAQPTGDPQAPARQQSDVVPIGRFNDVVGQRNQLAERHRALEADFNRLAGYVQALMSNSQPQQQVAGQQPQQSQPQAQMPDPALDPVGFANWQQAQFQQLVDQNTRQLKEQQDQIARDAKQQIAFANMKASEAAARATYGPAAPQLIKEATHAAVRAGLKDQFMAGPDPVGSAIRWYQQQATMQRYGSDPATVKNRVMQELMRDPAFVQQVAQTLRNGSPRPSAIPPPPSSMPRNAAAAPTTMFASGGQAVAAMLASRGMASA